MNHRSEYNSLEALELMRLSYAVYWVRRGRGEAKGNPVLNDGMNEIPSPVQPLWPEGWEPGFRGEWRFSIYESHLDNQFLFVRGTHGCFKNRYAVVFRGTANLSNVFHDLRLKMAPAGPTQTSDFSYVQGTEASSKKAELHSGFRESFESVGGELGRILEAIPASNSKDDSVDLLISGHSLGGAMASLCGAWLNSQPLSRPVNVKTYSFASPKVGNAAFASCFDLSLTRLGLAYRVARELDSVPQMPLSWQFPSDLSNPKFLAGIFPNSQDPSLTIRETSPIVNGLRTAFDKAVQFQLASTQNYCHIGHSIVLPCRLPVAWPEMTFPENMFDPPRSGVVLEGTLGFSTAMLQQCWHHWMWMYLESLLADLNNA